MPVNYTPPTAESLLPVPGVALGAAAAAIKNWTRDDVLLVLCEPGTVAAGVFTQNRFCAAPVIVCREHLARQHAAGSDFRALVVNAGNANAGTGDARPGRCPRRMRRGGAPHRLRAGGSAAVFHRRDHGAAAGGQDHPGIAGGARGGARRRLVRRGAAPS